MPTIAFSEAQVVLKARARLERPLMILLLLGIILFAIADQSVFYPIVAFVAVGLNLAAIRRSREVFLSNKLVMTGVAVATLQLLAELMNTHLGAELLLALGRYLVVIQLCKLFEHKTNRDYVQLLSMNLLLVSSMSLICENPVFAGVLIAYIGLAVYVAMVFTLKRGLDRASMARLTTESAPLHPQRVAWGAFNAWPDRPLISRALTVSVLLTVGAMVVFVLTPRLPAGRTTGLDGRSTTGFSGEVSLGRATRISASPEIVMQATQLNGPTEGKLYLRGHTLNAYKNSRWFNRSDHVGNMVNQFGYTVDSEVLDRASKFDMRMKPTLFPYVFAPAGLVWVQAPGFSVGMTPEGNRQLIGNPPSSRSVAYQAWALRPDYSPDDLRILSQTRIYPNPLISPKTTVECPPSVSALAREWAGMLADDRATLTRRLNELTASRLSPARSAYVGALMKEAGRLDRRIAQRIADRLKREYGYTLDLSEARRDRDAVEHFLFSMKAGHCEYFASSLTLMCRSLGVNARLATGFLTTEYDPSSATYIVRQRDAHAWTEVYAPQTGWAVVDATPGGPGPRDAGSLDGLSQWWAGVKFWWKERVIGYDRISQMNLVREIKQKLVELWAWIERTYAEVLAGLQELLLSGRITQAVQSFAVFIGICGVTILGVLLRRLHIERRREKHEIRQELGVSRRDLKFMVDLVVLLEKYKIHRRSHWTFMDLAQRAARQLSLDGKEVTALVDLYYRIRWGRSGVSREEVRQAEGLVARLEKRLSGRQAKQT